MTTQIIRRPAGRQLPATSDFPTPGAADWRCAGCSKLLGVFRDRQLHVRFARGHQYMTALPASCICRGCGTLNRASGPAR